MAKRSGPIYRTPHEKFLRDVEREELRQALHRLRVRFGGGKKPHYRAVCSCGWIGDERPERDSAETDGAKHVEDWLA